MLVSLVSMMNHTCHHRVWQPVWIMYKYRCASQSFEHPALEKLDWNVEIEMLKLFCYFGILESLWCSKKKKKITFWFSHILLCFSNYTIKDNKYGEQLLLLSVWVESFTHSLFTYCSIFILHHFIRSMWFQNLLNVLLWVRLKQLQDFMPTKFKQYFH